MALTRLEKKDEAQAKRKGAFVVLLGTVFPLLVEAVNGKRVSVGVPYFNRMTMPVGIALLFLMAVAPVLPWRKASGELLRHRLLWPAWIGTFSVVVAVLLGQSSFAALIAFADVDEATAPLATFTRLANYLGACALSLPAGLSADGVAIDKR